MSDLSGSFVVLFACHKMAEGICMHHARWRLPLGILGAVSLLQGARSFVAFHGVASETGKS